jgi:Uma2 family endonuclease
MQAEAPIKIGYTLADFLEESNTQPFELINGERIEKVASVFGHSKVIQKLFSAILSRILQFGLKGEVYNELTFILPGSYRANWVEGLRIPDVMYFAGDRIAQYEAANPDHNERPLELIPDFVAEVVSPNDKYTDINKKVDVYLQDGVRLIWVLDPFLRQAVVYAQGQKPLHFASGDVLDGGDVILDFTISLDDLFK